MTLQFSPQLQAKSQADQQPRREPRHDVPVADLVEVDLECHERRSSLGETRFDRGLVLVEFDAVELGVARKGGEVALDLFTKFVGVDIPEIRRPAECLPCDLYGHRHIAFAEVLPPVRHVSGQEPDGLILSDVAERRDKLSTAIAAAEVQQRGFPACHPVYR
jgi:hypothetical protein